MNQSSQDSEACIDWSGCPLVWTDPERMHGTPCVVNTRLPADTVIENIECFMEMERMSLAQAMAATLECFPLDEGIDLVRALWAYAGQYLAERGYELPNGPPPAG